MGQGACHHIGLGEQGVQLLDAAHLVKAGDGAGTAAKADDCAVKAAKPPRQGRADVAGAENHHGFPLQGALLPSRIPPVLALQGGIVGQLPAKGEDAGEHMLGNHRPVGARAATQAAAGGQHVFPHLIHPRPHQVIPGKAGDFLEHLRLHRADDGVGALDAIRAEGEAAAPRRRLLQERAVVGLGGRGHKHFPHASSSGSGSSTTMGSWWMAGRSFSRRSSRDMVRVEVEMHGWQDTSRPS